MKQSDYESFRERITDNIRTVLSLTEDNPLMERYNVQNLESYLRSLEMLERIPKEREGENGKSHRSDG